MRPTRQMFPGQLFVVLSSLAMIAGFPVHSSEKQNEHGVARRPVDCLTRILHAQPTYASGRLMGIKLFPNEPSTRQLFASLELRAGDIYDGGGRDAAGRVLSPGSRSHGFGPGPGPADPDPGRSDHRTENTCGAHRGADRVLPPAGLSGTLDPRGWTRRTFLALSL